MLRHRYAYISTNSYIASRDSRNLIEGHSAINLLSTDIQERPGLKSRKCRVKVGQLQHSVWNVVVNEEVSKPPLAFWSVSKGREVSASIVESGITRSEEGELPSRWSVECCCKS